MREYVLLLLQDNWEAKARNRHEGTEGGRLREATESDPIEIVSESQT